MAAGSNTTGSPQQRATASYSKNLTRERTRGEPSLFIYGFREQDLIQYHSHCIASCFSDLSRFPPSICSKNAICLASITRGSTLRSATKQQETDGTTVLWPRRLCGFADNLLAMQADEQHTLLLYVWIEYCMALFRSSTLMLRRLGRV